MSKVIDFPVIPEDLAIGVNRHTPEFMEAANAVGDYLKTLPLSNGQHNKLVELIIANIDVAEKGGFYAGINLGIAIAKDQDGEGG